jgi:hypothetical protein
MNLTEFPGELLVAILVHLDARSICRMFQVHPQFYSLINEECLWRQLCHRHLPQSVSRGIHRDYYCQHIPVFRYLWCTGRIIQVTSGNRPDPLRLNRIHLPRVSDNTIIPPVVGLIYQQPGHFGVAGTAIIRYEFPVLISQHQARQFITKLHPHNQLTYELDCGNFADPPSSLRTQLQIMEWTHRLPKSMETRGEIESVGSRIWIDSYYDYD